MLIEAKFDSKCAICKKPILSRRVVNGRTVPGDTIEWTAGTKDVAHEKCAMPDATLEDYFDANALADRLGFSEAGEYSKRTQEND